MKKYRIIVTIIAAIVYHAFSLLNAEEYDFKYQIIFKESGQLQAWVPLPQSDTFQRIADLEVITNLNYQIVFDSVYNNKFIFINDRIGAQPEELEVRFNITRLEAGPIPAIINPVQRQLFLAESRLVPFDDRFKNIAVKYSTTGFSFVKDIYNYVLDNMVYDKSGDGWGQGDAIYACDIGKGNCTDYHSLFNAIIRTRGIPTRFNIGFSIPDQDSGEIRGYHCWTEFFTPDSGWYPVDISEADKHPELKEYYFGTLNDHRVGFTVGRDIPLPRGTQQDIVNFIVFPYIKLNGIRTDIYEKRITFRKITSE